MSLIKKIYNKLQIKKLKKNIDKKDVSIGKILSRKSKILSFGSNNKVIIEDGVRLFNTCFDIHGNNNVIKIGKNTSMHSTYFCIFGDKNSVSVGDECGFSCNNNVSLDGGTSLEIGNECIFGSGSSIKTTDTHKILNIEGDVTNPSKNIKINNHCWICPSVHILKGVEIGENSIVATGSVVTKSVPQNVMCGGIPAKEIKRNINWKR